MRKIIAPAFVSLDGVMQAPGRQQEDPTGGFAFGGWVVPFSDDVFSQGTADNFGRPYDLLLGRKTYDIFAAYWPYMESDPAQAPEAGGNGIAEAFGRATKYVASRSAPSLPWRNSEWLGPDAVAAVRALKAGDGPDLLIQGSSDFVQSLFAADLVDEVRLLTFPVILGSGKRFFGTGARPAAFRLKRTTVSPTGVIVTIYGRAGEVQTGSFGPDAPTEASWSDGANSPEGGGT